MSHKCWKFGSNVSTDEIISTQYMTLTDIDELGKHVFESVKPGFADQISKGDILLAGENMGYGSSREHAPLSLKGAGIESIIACSFTRLFYRNCINIGMPVIIAPLAVENSEEGDLLSIDYEEGFITNETKGVRFKFDPFPEIIKNYLQKGGLINYINNKRKESFNEIY